MADTTLRGGRRNFLGSLTPGLLLLQPKTVFGSQANSAIEIGVVGCGSRGAWIGGLFKEFTGARIVAMADVAPDRVETFKAALKLDSGKVFLGRNAHRELSALKLDAVVIETPTYFHPEQAAAAVDAGKHVYLAKPVAVDVPGCRTITESGRKARGKTSFWVDFQFRARPVFQECVRRVRQGDLGTIVMAHFWYQAGRLPVKKRDGDTQVEDLIRNWFFDRDLSGDIIVEQNIHAIDGACWIMDAQPLKANGTGVRKARMDGNAYDHFAVHYTFPGNVIGDFCSTQCTKGLPSITVRLYGTEGSAEMVYRDTAYIKGSKPWSGPTGDDTFRGGAIDNIKAFVQSIRDGKPINNADEGVRSNLTAILGRTAAYRRTEVTWDEMMRANEKWEPKIAALG